MRVGKCALAVTGQETGLKFLRMVPLLLTGLRIAMGPAFLIVDRRQFGAEWLLLLVWAAMATDWLDGVAARRWNAVTTAGKLLDPFADALFCMIVFYVFARPHTSQGGGAFHMPLWGLGILIAREALVTFVVRPAAWAYGVVVAANWIGKAKTGLQFALMMLVLVPWIAKYEHFLWLVLAIAAFYLVLLFSVGSAVKYTVEVVGAVSQIRRSRGEGR
jgi:CDP-diacylglycerol--glycerol-3-phosphate 3-phosphatidyltransferase